MGIGREMSRGAMPLVLAAPWVIGMLISWIPFTKISLLEAPSFLIIASAISTLEVLSIVAVYICSSLWPDALNTEPAEPGRPSTWQEKFFRAWFWFLFVSPFCTSIFVVLMASDISCGDDDREYDLMMNHPICRVGVRMIKATALCRAGIM
ncbi:hypothetical protein ACJ41O_000222 [Fusarium nematophilum]